MSKKLPHLRLVPAHVPEALKGWGKRQLHVFKTRVLEARHLYGAMPDEWLILGATLMGSGGTLERRQRVKALKSWRGLELVGLYGLSVGYALGEHHGRMLWQVRDYEGPTEGRCGIMQFVVLCVAASLELGKPVSETLAFLFQELASFEADRQSTNLDAKAIELKHTRLKTVMDRMRAS